jgi:site-specific recombinase XerD
MAKSIERSWPELIRDFFTQRLQSQQHVSRNTLASYRDTIRLWLRFIEQKTGSAPCQQRLADGDAPHILAFLDSLERARACPNCSRSSAKTSNGVPWP